MSDAGDLDEAEPSKKSDSKEEEVSANLNSEGTGTITLSSKKEEVNQDNDAFLKSRLKFIKDDEGRDRCLDEDDGMVMAAWERRVAVVKKRENCNEIRRR